VHGGWIIIGNCLRTSKSFSVGELISAILYIYSPLILVVLKVIFCILVKLGIVCVLYCPSVELSTRNSKGRILEHFGQVLEEKGITRKNTSWKRIGSCLMGQGPSTSYIFNLFSTIEGGSLTEF